MNESQFFFNKSVTLRKTLKRFRCKKNVDLQFSAAHTQTVKVEVYKLKSRYERDDKEGKMLFPLPKRWA